MINLQNLKVIHGNGNPPSFQINRLNWDEFLRELDTDFVRSISVIIFEPHNESILMSYELRGISSFGAYIPTPHLKLLHKLYGMSDALARGVRFYILNSSSIKEQYRKVCDTESFWNGIYQEDKDWLMSIILGGHD